jgi:hypothetical protein
LEDEDEKTTKSSKMKINQHSIVVKDRFYQKLQKHFHTLKLLKGAFVKQVFLQEAIDEKLKNWEDTDTSSLPPDKSLNIRLTSSSEEKIEEIIDELRILGTRYCKKEFFLEALEEKLERDAENTKQLLLDFVKKSKKK